MLASIDPVADRSNVIVALDRGQVVGLVRLVRRRLWLGGVDLRVAGVTSVAASAKHRGKGVGVGVMDAALRAARHRGDDVSVLFARRAVDGWYGKFGYVGFGQHVSLTPAPRDKRATAPGGRAPRFVPVPAPPRRMRMHKPTVRPRAGCLRSLRRDPAAMPVWTPLDEF